MVTIVLESYKRKCPIYLSFGQPTHPELYTRISPATTREGRDNRPTYSESEGCRRIDGGINLIRGVSPRGACGHGAMGTGPYTTGRRGERPKGSRLPQRRGQGGFGAPRGVRPDVTNTVWALFRRLFDLCFKHT